jgi:general secretion pathway protein L
MHVLAIDAGSYSVKYLSTLIDKKRVIHTQMREYTLHEAMEENPSWDTFEIATQQLVAKIIEDVARPDSRIIMHVPPEMVTTRFLTLPVKNKKKAELMIPFQLEEDIPFSLQDSHFAYSLEIHKTQSLALVGLTRENDFARFYQLTTSWLYQPSVLTTEPAILDSFYAQNPVAGPYCVLDIGHKTTKAYLFYNSKLITTHVSYVGGKHIDEMIAQTYGINPVESMIYKHQNAFVLTESQKNDVDENQREFANIMEQVFKPLINDFHRWELGFRVSYGVKLSQVYLCGGTSNVKNISNFLTEHFKVKCSHLESFENTDTQKIDLNPKRRARFTLANMMALSLRGKSRLLNLLTGRYAMGGRAEFPLHTLSFLAARASAVSLVLILSLIVHRVFLGMDIKAVNAKVASVSKNPILGLTAREKRLITSQPETVAAILHKKKKAISQQISTLQSASEIKALSPLVTISALTNGINVIMTNFSVSDTGDVLAAFTSDRVDDLKNLESRLQSTNFKDIQVKIDANKKSLSFSGVE